MKPCRMEEEGALVPHGCLLSICLLGSLYVAQIGLEFMVLWIRLPSVGTIGMLHHAMQGVSLITSISASVGLFPHLCKTGVLDSMASILSLKKARNEAFPTNHK